MSTNIASRWDPARIQGWCDRHPELAALLALGGLVLICYELAPAYRAAQDSGGSVMVETASRLGPEPVADLVSRARAYVNRHVSAEVRAWARQLYANPMLYLVVPYLWLLEWLCPADRRRPVLRKAVLQDLVWFVASAPIIVLLVGAVANALQAFYDARLAFLTIEAATEWPLRLQLTAGILLGEFLLWFHHLLRHRWKVLWAFHSVHHSQRDLNVFTEDRVHFVDMLVAAVVSFIPLYMFQVPELQAAAVVALYRSIHARLLHTNTRLSFGRLGWLLVSPQFHRVHHSLDPDPRDTNYGVVLSVFDHLFGTASRDRHSYPATGIVDARFPCEASVPWWLLPVNCARQMVYPFVRLGLDLRRKSLRIGPETVVDIRINP